jgi:replicative DNA helicase
MAMNFKTRADKETSKLEPPHSTDAERSLLGAIFKDAEAMNAVVDVIDDERHFYVPRHRVIFRAMLTLYERGEPCDITTVANEMLRAQSLEQSGGRVYLVELAEDVVSSANVARYASIVLETALMRTLITTSTEIIRSCESYDQSVDTLLDEAERSIFDISERRIRKGFVPIKGLIADTLEHMGDEHFMSGTRTGFTELDKMTLGLHPGDLIVVAGRPSMGKTALAMNIAEYVATELKKAVGIFSVEMSKEQLVFRMLCGRAEINQHKLRSGMLSEREWPKLTIAGNMLSPAPIFIDDSAALSTLEMRAKARRLTAQHDVGLIVVDYIQLMHQSGFSENRQQEIALISRGMKALAKELNVPVIAISQLSRQVEQRGGDKRPQLSDLRESGAIEQDADLVMFVYRQELYMSHLDRDDPKYREVEGRAEIIVAKQRNGPTGSVHLAFRKELARFGNLETSHRELPPGATPVRNQDSPF